MMGERTLETEIQERKRHGRSPGWFPHFTGETCLQIPAQQPHVTNTGGHGCGNVLVCFLKIYTSSPKAHISLDSQLVYFYLSKLKYVTKF